MSEENLKKWYLEYDPITYKFIRNVLADKQPENSTEKDFTGLENPIYDPKTDSWSGDSLEEKYAKLRAQSAQDFDPVQQQIKELTMLVLQGGVK